MRSWCFGETDWRRFLLVGMPEVMRHLSYRIVDVSSVKVGASWCNLENIADLALAGDCSPVVPYPHPAREAHSLERVVSPVRSEV